MFSQPGFQVMVPTCHSFSIVVLALLSSCVMVMAEPEPVTKEAVLQSLESNKAAWQAKIRENSPRLYFSSKEWPGIQKAIETMPPNRAAALTAFYADMDRIVALPLPVYMTPEDMVGKRGDATSLYSAMEELWQREIGDQIFALSVAVRLKPESPYRAKLHDLVMTAIGFETWGRNKLPMGNNSDLAAGHLGRGIATAYDWHKTLFSETERVQIRKVVAERMANMLGGLYGNAFWARGFQENHNQVSVAALGFCGIAFYDEIPQAPEWLAAARLNFLKVAEAAAADGSSVEGVSYWAYGISYILQYIEATRLITDSGDLYQTPFLKNAAAFRLMAATPGLVGNIPWGDAVMKDWSPPHHIIYRLAAEYQDTDAAWFADHLPSLKGDALNILWASKAPVGGEGPKNLDGRLFVNDLVSSRSGWEEGDYLLSIKAGFTNRNHSHLDAGALAIAFGSEWVLAAPGYGKGANEGAFWQSGGTRWNYFSNSTESHSTLLINGKNQSFDRKARGTITDYFSSSAWNSTIIDLTGAYQDVKSVTRQVLHRRGDYILVFDSVSAAQPVSVEWLAQLKKEPGQEKDGSLLAKGSSGQIFLKMLSSATPFSLRTPTSPKVDVKAPFLTYAIKESGTNPSFTTLLQPIPANRQKPAVKAKMESPASGVSRIEVAGEGWTDHVMKTGQSAVLSFTTAADGADVKVTGRLAALRSSANTLQSLLVLGATEVRLADFVFSSTTPADLDLQKTTGGWQVGSSRDVRDDITVPAGQTIRFISNTSEGKDLHAAQ